MPILQTFIASTHFLPWLFTYLTVLFIHPLPLLLPFHSFAPPHYCLPSDRQEWLFCHRSINAMLCDKMIQNWYGLESNLWFWCKSTGLSDKTAVSHFTDFVKCQNSRDYPTVKMWKKMHSQRGPSTYWVNIWMFSYERLKAIQLHLSKEKGTITLVTRV